MFAIHVPTWMRLVAAPISRALAMTSLLASAATIASKPASSASRAIACVSAALQPTPGITARASRSAHGEHRQPPRSGVIWGGIWRDSWCERWRRFRPLWRSLHNRPDRPVLRHGGGPARHRRANTWSRVWAALCIIRREDRAGSRSPGGLLDPDHHPIRTGDVLDRSLPESRFAHPRSAIGRGVAAA